MKPYMNLKGKGMWSWVWGEKPKKKFRKIFKKSQRQKNKKYENTKNISC